jgi:hypothetical protein
MGARQNKVSLESCLTPGDVVIHRWSHEEGWIFKDETAELAITTRQALYIDFQNNTVYPVGLGWPFRAYVTVLDRRQVSRGGGFVPGYSYGWANSDLSGVFGTSMAMPVWNVDSEIVGTVKIWNDYGASIEWEDRDPDGLAAIVFQAIDVAIRRGRQEELNRPHFTERDLNERARAWAVCPKSPISPAIAPPRHLFIGSQELVEWVGAPSNNPNLFMELSGGKRVPLPKGASCGYCRLDWHDPRMDSGLGVGYVFLSLINNGLADYRTAQEWQEMRRKHGG